MLHYHGNFVLNVIGTRPSALLHALKGCFSAYTSYTLLDHVSYVLNPFVMINIALSVLE